MKHLAKKGIAVLNSLALAMTFLPVVRTTKWWVRIFDFPKSQIASLVFLAIALSIKYKFHRSREGQLALAGLLAAIAYQMSFIVRYTPLYPKEARAALGTGKPCRFTVLQANVRMDNRNTTAFIDLVKNEHPDIITINEPNQWWAERLAELDELYPYTLKHPQENTYGMMLFSRLPIKKQELNFLVEDDIPSVFATVTLPGGRDFDLHCLHPRPPQPYSDTWERDTELLLVGKRIKETNRPALVAGDLNDVAWSYTSRRFQKLYQLLDPRVGRGTYNTYNVYTPLFRYPLDHFFYTPEFALHKLRKLKSFGSDHFPVLIDLSLDECPV